MCSDFVAAGQASVMRRLRQLGNVLDFVMEQARARRVLVRVGHTTNHERIVSPSSALPPNVEQPRFCGIAEPVE